VIFNYNFLDEGFINESNNNSSIISPTLAYTREALMKLKSPGNKERKNSDSDKGVNSIDNFLRYTIKGMRKQGLDRKLQPIDAETLRRVKE
jgi:hypothetical protein